jgi:aminocarboxymuconate-semialdehyde decarboxylase
LHGVSIGGNLNGITLDDERFFPLYEKMNELETVVFIHPGLPPWGKSGLEKYYLWAALGYQFDTVVAASTLMYGGVLDLFPKIKFVFSHLGGGLPFLVHRLTGTAKDRGSVDPSGKIKAQKKAKDYLKSVYYDTSVSDVDSFRQSFRCTYEFAGGDNILFGSDYPWYDWEFISKLKGAIEKMDIPNNDKGKILGGNAKKLLKIS